MDCAGAGVETGLVGHSSGSDSGPGTGSGPGSSSGTGSGDRLRSGPGTWLRGAGARMRGSGTLALSSGPEADDAVASAGAADGAASSWASALWCSGVAAAPWRLGVTPSTSVWCLGAEAVQGCSGASDVGDVELGGDVIIGVLLPHAREGFTPRGGAGADLAGAGIVGEHGARRSSKEQRDRTHPQGQLCARLEPGGHPGHPDCTAPAGAVSLGLTGSRGSTTGSH